MDDTVLVTGDGWDRGGARPAAAGAGRACDRARAQPRAGRGGGRAHRRWRGRGRRSRLLRAGPRARRRGRSALREAEWSCQQRRHRLQHGAAACERTEDGHEPTWQVNFLSAFLLTMGLQDPLVAGRGRVVHMSSGVHSSGSVDLEQPDEPRYASPYAQSKIALVMLACEQGERWRDLGVDVNACSPGWIATKMGGPGGGPIAEGVDTPLWLLTAPSSRARPAATSGSGTRRSRTRRSRTPTPGHGSGTWPSGPSAVQTDERSTQRLRRPSAPARR